MKGNYMGIEKLISILANRIRTLRNSLGWTQERLAEEINVHPTYISRIESCKKIPTVNIISSIADAFKIEAYELFVDDSKIDTYDYKKKKIISILKESSPSNIDVYSTVISTLHKTYQKRRKNKPNK